MRHAFESEYAYWPFVISMGVLLGGAGVFLLVALIVLTHAYCSKKMGVTHLRIISFVLFALACLSTLAMAVAQGLDTIHVAVSSVVGFLIWFLLLPVIFVFAGGNAERVLWLKSDGSGSAFASQRRGGGKRRQGVNQENDDGFTTAVAPPPVYHFNNNEEQKEEEQRRKQREETELSSTQKNILFHPSSSSATTAAGSGTATVGLKLTLDDDDEDEIGGISMKEFSAQNQNNNNNNNNNQKQSEVSSNSSHHSSASQNQQNPNQEQEIVQKSRRKKDPEETIAARFIPVAAGPGSKRTTSLSPASSLNSTLNSPDFQQQQNNSRSSSVSQHSTASGASSASTTSLAILMAKAELAALNNNENSPTRCGTVAGRGTKSGGEKYSSSETAPVSAQKIPARRSPNSSLAVVPYNRVVGSDEEEEEDENHKSPSSHIQINTSLASSAGSPTTTTTTTGFTASPATDLSHGNSFCGLIRAFLSLCWEDISSKPFLFLLCVLFAVAALVSTNLILYGTCVMNKPQSLSTWILRRGQRKICPANGKPCFVYPLVGDVCSSMVLASHFVVADDSQIPNSVSARICEFNSTSTSSSSSPSRCATISGILRNKDDFEEDRRYVGQIYIQGLKCGLKHTAVVTFSTSSSQNFVSDQICFLTLPGSASSSTSSSSQKELTFIEGGDYVVKGKSSKPSKGKTLVLNAMALAPNAAFFAIGGDLAYENNMRRCYRRVDEFLEEVLEALKRPSDGCVVPFLTANGNHCSGGYLWQNSRGDNWLGSAANREKASAFYFQYYPFISYTGSSSQQQHITQPENGTSGNLTLIQSAPNDVIGDFTSTFHNHLIGTRSGMVVADSGHWSPMATQSVLLRNALAHVRSLNRTTALMYHVPVWPSTRDRDSLKSAGHYSKKLHDVFGPVFEDYDDVLTLVFENHDHNYKRTNRLHGVNGSSVVISSPAQQDILVKQRRRGRGIIFDGDGALGASDFSELLISPKQLAKGRTGNYVAVVDLFVNGSMAVKAIASDKKIIDQFIAL